MGVWALVLLLFGVVSEIILHNISYPGKSTIYYVHHEVFGTWRKPNQRAVKIADCYEVDEILVNSYGMRGAEPDIGKKIKVGIFGDSMTEGIQVNEKDHFVTRLNEANDSVDYLNFATSSTTTVYHLLNLKYHHPIFDFDKIIVFFFPANDIQDNSIDLQVQANGKRFYYPSFKKDGKGGYVLDYDYRPTGWKYKVRDVLRKSLVFQKLYTIQAAFQQAKTAVATPAASGIKALPVSNQVYGKKWTPAVREAYEITDYTFMEIKSFCEANKIALQVVMVPSVGDVLNEEEMRLHYSDMADLMDREGPYRYYKAFFEKNNISTIDLFQAAHRRIKERGMVFPYFSYECDGHFAKAGHDLIFDTLKSAGY